MRKSEYKRLRWTRKNIIVLVLTMLVSIVALIYALPRESKFGFVYEENRPWRYAQLIATYDFPIYKTEAEMQQERDSLLTEFRPFYTLDTLKAQQVVGTLRGDFTSGRIADVPVYYLPRISELLQEVYAIGIVRSDDLNQLKQEGIQQILITRGNVATERSVASLLTPATAYEHIVHQGMNSTEHELIERCRLRNYLTANVSFNQTRTEAEREELLQVLPTQGLVQSGELIIDRGQIVTPAHMKVLDSMKRESEQRNDPTKGYWMVLLGQVVYVVGILGLFFFYLWLFRRDYLQSPHSLLLLFTLIVLFPLLTYWLADTYVLNIYLIPYAIVPIFVRIFMDSRTAFVSMVVAALLSAVVAHSPFLFLLLQVVTGMAAIYTLRELTERSQLLRTAAAVIVVGVLVVAAYECTQSIHPEHLDYTMYINITIGGVLILFAYPLMYLVERLFGFTSSVTLIELSNINHPILRRMSKVAQGTFNHSMQVANLAAEVADKIGAKAQLARTGALYHDIGKTMNPAFFTENQSGVNPHNELSEERSAQIIIGHVTEGLRLAEKHHLPEVIREFIVTHHGAGMAKYFYIQYVNKHPEEEVDKSLFTYPGHHPYTREQAVLMMCDAVEAASRSLKEYTEESISNLVNKIIDGQQAEGCFAECPLTFRDIADAKRVLIDSLKTIYHTRIAYPELRQQQPTNEAPSHTGIFGTGLHRTWKK